MSINFGKQLFLSVFVVIFGLSNCEAAFAAVRIQPFLCASTDGSNAIWATVQGHHAIGMTLRGRGDKGGANFLGLSGVKGDSTVTALILTNPTSANLSIGLTLKTSTNQTLTVRPTSRSGDTCIFNLAAYGLKSNVSITNLAVFAQNSTGSPGTIFLTHFVLNGTHETNSVNSTGGCLNF
jgi:hypothetical protein